jgi:thiosulfate dehydrogenase [quinone] large subunit
MRGPSFAGVAVGGHPAVNLIAANQSSLKTYYADLGVQSFPMNEKTDPSTHRGEYTAAFLILRLFLGLRAFFAGLEKFESGGRYTFEAYYQNMTRMATGITGASFLPLWATKPFALSLGYILLALGVTLLLGLRTRCSLILMGLVYVGLSFGLMVVQETEGVAWLAIHVALVAGALVLVRHNRFALWPDKND